MNGPETARATIPKSLKPCQELVKHDYKMIRWSIKLYQLSTQHLVSIMSISTPTKPILKLWKKYVSIDSMMQK